MGSIKTKKTKAGQKNDGWSVKEKVIAALSIIVTIIGVATLIGFWIITNN